MPKSKPKYILGVTGLATAFHDNSAALLKDGRVVFAATEERYSRVKHDKNYPALSVKKAFEKEKIKYSDIETLAVGYPNRFLLAPFSKDYSELLRVVASWVNGRGFNFIKDSWDILAGELTQNSNESIKNINFPKDKITYVDHHLAHAASAYFTSGFDNCVAIAMDAFGPKTDGTFLSGAVYRCSEGKLTLLEEIGVSESIGLFYTSVTQALEFTPGDGEGKTMGLAAYGKPGPAYKALRELSPKFVGSWQKTKYWAEMFFANRKEFRPIFNELPVGKILSSLVAKHGKENVAASVQLILEEEMEKYFRYLLKKYKTPFFAAAGGLFLNVKMNKTILEIPGIKDLYIHPNAGDGGTAFGAAQYVYSKIHGLKTQKMTRADLGSEYTPSEILKELKKHSKKISFVKEKNIAKTVAKKLVEGRVIGWYQGRFEWGPRALGYRSVLIDPRRMDIKEILNNTLKNREWFMPFAPSVLEEKGSEYFKNFRPSPFMTLAFDVIKSKVKDIKAAIHIDNTARPNTVTKTDNKMYYEVIREFEKLTGIPVVLNTSFNKHGLPIVDSPKDAVEHLLDNCIEELAIGDYLVVRK